jgi:hypothetical protein
MWMTVNAVQGQSDAKGHIYMALICRVADVTVDEKADTKIEKSAPFEVPDKPTTIACAVSASFLMRVIPHNPVSISLIALPSKVSLDEVHSLSDVERLKGSIVITRVVEQSRMSLLRIAPIRQGECGTEGSRSAETGLWYGLVQPSRPLKNRVEP